MLNEALVTILSTFVGAWLAYKWGERTQKGIEQRACEAEIKKDRENKTWQLNYLNTFLYTHITAFIELFQHLQVRLEILKKLSAEQQCSENDIAKILRPIADYQIDFPLNTNELLFVADDTDFIKGLAFTKTYLTNYYNAIQMLNNDLPQIQTLYMSRHLTTEIVKTFEQKNKYVLEEVAWTICTFHKTLQIAKEYNNKHDKLPLNDIKEFTREEQETIKTVTSIRQSIVAALHKKK